jgi:hypothetical protein
MAAVFDQPTSGLVALGCHAMFTHQLKSTKEWRLLGQITASRKRPI